MSKEYPSEHFRPHVGQLVKPNEFGMQLQPELKRGTIYTVTLVGADGWYHFASRKSPVVTLNGNIQVMAVGLKPA